MAQDAANELVSSLYLQASYTFKQLVLSSSFHPQVASYTRLTGMQLFSSASTHLGQPPQSPASQGCCCSLSPSPIQAHCRAQLAEQQYRPVVLASQACCDYHLM
jgi:hypothetical protein